VTDDNRAAVVLRIDKGAFADFRSNAKCTIRLQGLIGERFVECDPGTSDNPRLARIEGGDGEGEHLLPLENTSSPVDLDLLNSIMRLPYRQRLSILLNEFGTGLAGRGEDLNEAIHRANPALRETEALLKELAKQNRVLARLAVNSDRALAPLARERRRVSSWIVEANRTGEATAERRGEIRRSFNRLPAFLRELKPLMADLDSFAVAGTPVVRDLGAAAPDLARLLEAQGDLADASRKSFPSLGDALERGRPALIRSRPIIRSLGRFALDARPLSRDLDELTASLDETGAPERIMDFLYYVTLSVNGYDSLGHYLRAGLVTNQCSNYQLVGSSGCNATFYDPTDIGAASNDTLEARNAPEPEPGSGGSVAPTGGLLQNLLGKAGSPYEERLRKENLERLQQRSRTGSPGLGPADPALEYLLGDDG
jgi:ABC-type transporter Mla subunit MlaD